MILGMDIGGTNIRLGLVDGGALKFACTVIPSRVLYAASPENVLADMILEYIARNGVDTAQLQCVSIGVPACVSRDFRTVFCAPNLRREDNTAILDNFDLAGSLEKRFEIPVYVNKDTNFLLSFDIEYFNLTGVVAGCYIGTGIGGAVSINGQLLYGKNGFAMDIGHTHIYGNTSLCGCGNQGCAETSGSGAELLRIRKQYFTNTAIEKIFTEHASEAPLCEFLEKAAFAPALLATVFDPDCLVLGGGVLEMQDFPRERFVSIITSYTERAIASSGLTVRFAEKLSARGVIGAACFARSLIDSGRKTGAYKTGR